MSDSSQELSERSNEPSPRSRTADVDPDDPTQVAAITTCSDPGAGQAPSLCVVPNAGRCRPYSGRSRGDAALRGTDEYFRRGTTKQLTLFRPADGAGVEQTANAVRVGRRVRGWAGDGKGAPPRSWRQWSAHPATRTGSSDCGSKASMRIAIDLIAQHVRASHERLRPALVP